MASWITHIRIADKIQSKEQYSSFRYFLIGNVAPDSGVLNKDGLTYSPSKEISHFYNDIKAKWGIADLRYYRSYILSRARNSVQSDEECFHLGYFTHLIVDTLWSFFIFGPVYERYKKFFEKDKLFGWEIKKDWHGVDVEYLKENKNCEIFETFKTSYYTIDCLDYYPQAYIQQKLEQIKNNFDTESAFVRPNKYLSKQDWELFIQAASKLVMIVLDNIEAIECKYDKSVMEYLEDKYDFFSGVYGDINQAYSKLMK